MAKLEADKLIGHYSSIYENTPFITSFKEPNLNILYCNKLMRDFIGYPALDDVVGKCDYDFRWAKFASLYAKHELDALNNNLYVAIFPTCNFQGTEAVVMVHRTPIFEDIHAPLGILTHAYFLQNKASLELSNILCKKDPQIKDASYTIGKNIDDIHLTRRERECLFYCIRGKSCKLIAMILGLSVRTVEVHLSNLKLKFGCTFKSELIERAVEMGYLYDLPATLFDKNLVDSLKAE